MNGVVLIDKPSGCTSHDVVNRWRKLANTRRAGHLGTLDPMATGLLVLLSGTATRLAQFFGKEDKTYAAEITFGLISDTYDIEGRLTAAGAILPDPESVIAAVQFFRGRIVQTPPAISAKKINGVPAYKLARRQIPVELKPVEIEVKQLQVQQISRDKLTMSITCSSGTYIRCIAHDLGQQLGCGAVLSKLRRTSVGDFKLEQAKTLQELGELAAAGRLIEAAIAPGSLLPQIPSEYFDIAVESQIRQGRDFRASPFVIRPGTPLIKALSYSGELIAIGELKMPNVYHPGTVL